MKDNHVKPDSLKATQFGGGHYKIMAIEPVEYIEANNIPFTEGNAIKYLSRHQSKNGAEDLKKAVHFTAMALERRYGIRMRYEFVEDAKTERKNES